MIEVLFGESEAASMKAAKRLYKKEKSKWGDGRSDDVICLGFMLDIGDIREKADSKYRSQLIYSMYAQEQWGSDEAADAELQECGDCYCDELRRLQKYLEDGEPIRIWYSDAPYSICGFYHLCSILQKYENEIRAVKLPQYKMCSNAIVQYQNWGEVSAEEFAGFLRDEKKLAKEEIRMYSALWNELREDDSPLRAVVNGKVLGVPEDFYDFLIWKSFTKEPVKQARLIGNILGKNPIGMNDLWYAKRIDFFITQGKIAVIENSENKYARTIGL